MTGAAPDAGHRRWRLRTWSPDYERGSRPEAGELGTPQVDAPVEVPVAGWAPQGVPSARARGPTGPTPELLPPIAFVDGVQRVDAWADVEAVATVPPADAPGDDTLGEALFASYLAG